MEVIVEDIEEVQLIDREEAVSAVAAVPPADAGSDRSYVEGHEAGAREALEAVAVQHAAAMEAIESRHEKVLAVLSSKSTRAAAIVAKRHAKALQAAQDDATDASADVAEAEAVADTARLVAIQEVLDLLDARIDHGHTDGRLAVMDVRNLIAEHFKEE